MNSKKKKTIFCDIDGTLFKYRKFETYQTTIAEPINDVIKKINDAFKNGDMILLTTARPEYIREHTINELEYNNVKYHRLIMGIERGTRILINDKENIKVDRAYSFSLERDKGFQKNTTDDYLWNYLVVENKERKT